MSDIHDHDARIKHDGDLPLEVRERERDRAVAAIHDYVNRLKQSPAAKAGVVFSMTIDGEAISSVAMGDSETLAMLCNANALGVIERM